MSLIMKNTRDAISPEKFKLKMLVYAPPGFGKTTFAAGAPNPLVAVCDTGHMKGLLPAAHRELNYVEPETYAEFEMFCGNNTPGSHPDSLIVDPITPMTKRFIKDYVLATIPRRGGDSPKRAMGVPELDDYQGIEECTRRLLARLLDNDKHIVVTAHEQAYQPQVIDGMNSSNNKKERLGGPELPGQLSIACCAMFDVVLRGVKQSTLRDPRDPKSRYEKRVWLTESAEKYVAKNRISVPNGKSLSKSLFPPEVEFDLEKGSGTWEYFYTQALNGYKELYAQLQATKVSGPTKP